MPIDTLRQVFRQNLLAPEHFIVAVLCGAVADCSVDGAVLTRVRAAVATRMVDEVMLQLALQLLRRSPQ